MNRTTTAFLVTPLIPAVLLVLAISLVGLTSRGQVSPAAVTYAVPLWLFYFLPVSYGAALIFGLPGWVLFRRMGWLSSGRLSIGGAALGLILGCLIGVLFSSDSPSSIAAIAIASSALGTVSGFSFWWLAYRPTS